MIPFTAEAEVAAEPEATDRRFHSVSTIIRAVGSDDALIGWAANMTARAAVRSQKTWQSMVEETDEEEAIRWLAQARYRAPKGQRSASQLGSAAHSCFEIYVVTGKRPAMGMELGGDLGLVDREVEPYIDSFEMFLDRFSPSFQAAEVVVYDTKYGYAGMCDGFATIEGMPAILDYKTSKESFTARGQRKGPYSDVALQLSAYRFAEMAAVWRARRFEHYSRRYYLLSEAERELAVPVPTVGGGIAVHVTPLHCDVYPIECGPEVHRSFLYAIEAARWSYERAKTVIGEPLALMDKKGTTHAR